MRVEWHGQSAFTLASDEATVFIDPFGDMGPLLADRGLKFEHPPIEVAGTERGPNTIFVFELDGLRVAHFGDFGQR
jgi:L-ascorbate metabolism protein UlaG (beta-lactamase superfamily)